MLLNLHVKNFALIDEADLDFSEGLNILTGETGAGKSLLIDSVNAALGGRIRGDVVRKGADSAYIEMVFSIEDEERKLALQAMDVSTEYDCILISRKIMGGRSIHKINDEAVTSSKVRQVTELLLDIHGQHEHQSLLHKQKHLEILDEFSDKEAHICLKQVGKLYSEYQNCKSRRAGFDVDPEFRRREMDFLEYEIHEIEDIGMTEGETEALEQEYRKLMNGHRLAEALGSVLSELEEGENGSASECLSRGSRGLREAIGMDSSLMAMMEPLETAADLVTGVCRELHDYLDSLSYEPENLFRMEQRLDQLHRLESKYGGGYEVIQRSLEEKREKLQEWQDYENRKAEAAKRLLQVEEELSAACDILSSMRRKAAIPLAAAIRQGLVDLNFLQVDFQISFTALKEYTSKGRDSVEFLISTNPGEPPRPLGQVASGGELSRIMLAIKAVLADRDQIPTLIFDEIDTGISGRTAQKVSEKLSVIGKHRQVICITHLPQIAAMADCHFCIEKNAGKGAASTGVHVLNDREQVAELARLLGGAELTEAVYRNASEMKELARRTKSTSLNPN